jgi:hypothetical protein
MVAGGDAMMLSIGTSLFVLSIAGASALSAGKLARTAYHKIISTSKH